MKVVRVGASPLKKKKRQEDVDSLASSREGGIEKEPLSMAEKWNLNQLKKDNRYQKVAAINVDVEGAEMKQQFRDYDDITELSVRIYMTEAFKGLLPPNVNGLMDLEKTETQQKAEMLLMMPLEEL